MLLVVEGLGGGIAAAAALVAAMVVAVVVVGPGRGRAAAAAAAGPRLGLEALEPGQGDPVRHLRVQRHPGRRDRDLEQQAVEVRGHGRVRIRDPRPGRGHVRALPLERGECAAVCVCVQDEGHRGVEARPAEPAAEARAVSAPGGDLRGGGRAGGSEEPVSTIAVRQGGQGGRRGAGQVASVCGW